MALHTVSQLKDAVVRRLPGIQLGSTMDVDGYLEDAARAMLLETDIPEASAREAITLYDGVYDYSVSQSIFGQSVIDLVPQGNFRTPSDTTRRINRQEFDRYKKRGGAGSRISFIYDNGAPIARIESARPQSLVVVDSMQESDDWTAAGSASGLAEDTADYYEYPHSLRFTLTGSSTGTLTKTISALSVSNYENLGVVFLAIKTPSASSLTSVTLRIGSDASNYDEVTATTGFLGAWQADKWLLVKFDMSTAASTGTPDWSALDYVQLRIAHTATMTNFRVGDLFMSLPSPHEFVYPTAAIWKAGSANPSQTITANSDTILLSDPAFQLLAEQSAYEIASGKGKSGAGLAKEIHAELYGSGRDVGKYAKYRAENPSQRLKEVNTYSGSARRLARQFRSG